MTPASTRTNRAIERQVSMVFFRRQGVDRSVPGPWLPVTRSAFTNVCLHSNPDVLIQSQLFRRPANSEESAAETTRSAQHLRHTANTGPNDYASTTPHIRLRWALTSDLRLH